MPVSPYKREAQARALSALWRSPAVYLRHARRTESGRSPPFADPVAGGSAAANATHRTDEIGAVVRSKRRTTDLDPPSVDTVSTEAGQGQTQLTRRTGTAIMKRSTTTHVSVDGVMEGLGAPDEDRSGGFERGGWAIPLFDTKRATSK
jgi:hypothetical protein